MQDKAVYLMTRRDLKPVAQFIYESFEDRSTMLDSLSTLNDIIENIDRNEKHSARTEADVRHVMNSMINKIVNFSKNDKNGKSYVIKNIENNGLKITLASDSQCLNPVDGKRLYSIKDVSENGLKFKIVLGANT